jgi:phenylacetate-CoA ligase
MTLAKSLNALVMRAGRGAPNRLLRLVGWLPIPMLDWLRGSALRRTVRLAGERSRFYREKFGSLGIEPGRVRRLSDLEKCFTTSEELRAASPEDLLCGTPETVVESSGTTGRVTRIYLSREELEYAAWQGSIFFAMVGIGRGDRILGAFDYSWGLGGIYTDRILAHSGLFGVCPGLVDPQEAVDRLTAQGFTVVIADPFWISRLTEVAMARGIRTPMKAFISGAERITDTLRAQIEGYWRAPLYMSYGSTELGATLGGECRVKQGYHLNEYDFAVEVVDADEDGYGEVVFTTLNRSVMPLIRYRTRDIARFIPEPCACGLPFRRLSPIRGRRDEVIACVWGDVHPDLFADLLCGAPGVGDEWQVSLTQPGLRPVFEFRLEVEGGVEGRIPILSHIRQRLAQQYPALWAKCQQQLCDIDVRIEPSKSLRTGRKLRRLVDERDSSSRSG